MIIWSLDLQLHMQSVPITIQVLSSNPTHFDVYLIQLYMIKFSVTCDRSVVFSGYSGFLQQKKLPATI